MTRSPSHEHGGVATRVAAWLSALALVALPIVGVMNGWFASDRWPFRQLKLDATFERVSAEQLRSAAAPHLAVGFFAVDLDAVREAIEATPWVERAEVRKRWPDLLEVRVIEREALALWGDSRLVSASGELFAVPGHTAPEGLPMLDGPDARVGEVLAFHDAAVAALIGTGLHASGVRLSSRGSWSLILASGATVVIGREQPRRRLARFIATLKHLDGAVTAELAGADLRYANGFALRMLPPPVAPPAPTAAEGEGEAIDPQAPQAPAPAAPAPAPAQVPEQAPEQPHLAAVPIEPPELRHAKTRAVGPRARERSAARGRISGLAAGFPARTPHGAGSALPAPGRRFELAAG